MTLLIASGTPEYAVIASDRRLSWNGDIVDDDANKATVVACADARVAIVYTGLARCGNFSTEDWIWSTLSGFKSPTARIDEILLMLQENVHQYMIQLPCKPASKKLTLLIAGFRYDVNNPPILSCWKISNYEFGDGDEFQIRSYNLDMMNNNRWILGGSTKSVKQRDLKTLDTILDKSRKADAVEAKTVNIIKNAAQDNKSVGSNVNCCIIYANPNNSMQSTYYAEDKSRIVYGVNSVFIFPNGQGGPHIFGAQHIVGDQMPFVSIPKVGRNAPCSCGSGLKFKHCHRNWKYSYTYLPIGAEYETSKEHYPSGQKFTVQSRGGIG